MEMPEALDDLARDQGQSSGSSFNRLKEDLMPTANEVGRSSSVILVRVDLSQTVEEVAREAADEVAREEADEIAKEAAEEAARKRPTRPPRRPTTRLTRRLRTTPTRRRTGSLRGGFSVGSSLGGRQIA
jgi:hypothetical protein